MFPVELLQIQIKSMNVEFRTWKLSWLLGILKLTLRELQMYKLTKNSVKDQTDFLNTDIYVLLGIIFCINTEKLIWNVLKKAEKDIIVSKWATNRREKKMAKKISPPVLSFNPKVKCYASFCHFHFHFFILFLTFSVCWICIY